MTVKLAILKSGENLISNIKEAYYQESLMYYIFEDPCEVKLAGSYALNGGDFTHSITLNNWPILSKDRTVEIHPEWIVTIVEPVDRLKELYENRVSGDEQNGKN
jgi:hypothetical protein